MEKHHSCLNTRAIIEYFQERQPEAIPALLEGLGPEITALPNPLDFLMEINNWVSSEVIIRIFNNARRLTGREEIAFDLGFQSVARKKLGYVQRIILFALKNPRRSLKRAQAINDKFNKNKKIEIVKTTRDRAVIRLHWDPEIPGVIDFCRFNQGIYAGIPTIWNLPPAQVVETRCFFKGDDCCEYHLKWEKRFFLREAWLRLVMPWSLLKSTIEELEQDKEVLKHKFDEIHALNLQLREKVDHLLCLNQTSAAAMSLHQLDDMVRACLELLTHFTRLDRVAIFLLDETDMTLFLHETAGLAPELAGRVRDCRVPLLEPGRFLARVAMESVLTAFSPESSEAEAGPPDLLLEALDITTGLAAPLRVRHKIVGVLLAGVQPGAAIRGDEKELLNGFANQLAVAIENAGLYDKLEKSERQYRGLVQNAHEGIWIVEDNGAIRFANLRMQEITGDPRLAGKNLADFWAPGDYREVETVLAQNRQGLVVQKELEIISRDRGPVAVMMSSVPLSENGRFLGTFAMFTDISDMKAMEKQLSQHQKMEAVGTLAGGIAHNFNNLLMNIMGLTGLILAGMHPGDPAHADLKLIEQEVLKGSALTKQLLTLGRGGRFSPKPTDLNALLNETAGLFCRTRQDVAITCDLAAGLPPVEVDAGQMEQVLLNLFVNAWQAMSRKGRMTLASRQVKLSEAFCEPYGRPPGPYMHLSLTDTGKGMDEATLARIFEPFFTTKEVGQGTGLGLATVYGIVKNHRGIIRVDSQPGQGTTFHIFLPVSGQAAAAALSQKEVFATGSGAILLVDDEDSVRKVAGRMLEQLGYQIRLAASGAEAVKIFRRERHKIRLVILDMVMPGQGGAEIYRELQAMDPEVRVLLSSGYCLDGETQALMSAGARGFIQKPYRLATLSHNVAAILGQS